MSSDGYYLFAGDGSLTWETALTNNVTYAVRVILGSVPIDRLGVEIATAQASSAVRLGVYDDADGIPGDVVLDAGTVATTSAGIRQVSFSPLEVEFGLYWVTATPQNSGSMPTYVANVDLSWQDFLQTKTMTTGHQHTGSAVDANGYTGALGPFGAPGTPTRVSPRIFYRNFSSANEVEMSGSGVLSATGVHVLSGSVALTGSGTVAGTGVHRLNGTAALTGTGTVSATATVTTPGPTLLLINGSTSNASSYVTASISPATNALLLATISHDRGGANPNQPTLTGCGLTWVVVESLINVGAAHRTTTFRALGTTTPGALTIDMAGQTQGNCFWSVTQFVGVNTSGTNGSGAIVQHTSGTDGVTTHYEVSLGSSTSDNNIVYGAFASPDYCTISPTFDGNLLGALGLSGAGALEAQYSTNSDQSCSTNTPVYLTGVVIEVEVV